MSTEGETARPQGCRYRTERGRTWRGEVVNSSTRERCVISDGFATQTTQESFSQMHKPQEKYHLVPFLSSFHCASVSSLHCCQHCFNYTLQLMSIVDYTSSMFVCTAVGRLVLLGYTGLSSFIVEPKTMVFLACEQFPPLCSAVAELRPECSRFNLEQRDLILIFVPAFFTPLCTTLLFLVDGAFSSCRLAVLSCDLVY